MKNKINKLTICLILFVLFLILNIIISTPASFAGNTGYSLKGLIDEASSPEKQSPVSVDNAKVSTYFTRKMSNNVGKSLTGYGMSGNDWTYIQNNRMNANCVQEGVGSNWTATGSLDCGLIIDVNPILENDNNVYSNNNIGKNPDLVAYRYKGGSYNKIYGFNNAGNVNSEGAVYLAKFAAMASYKGIFHTKNYTIGGYTFSPDLTQWKLAQHFFHQYGNTIDAAVGNRDIITNENDTRFTNFASTNEQNYLNGYYNLLSNLKKSYSTYKIINKTDSSKLKVEYYGNYYIIGPFNVNIPEFKYINKSNKTIYVNSAYAKAYNGTTDVSTTVGLTMHSSVQNAKDNILITQITSGTDFYIKVKNNTSYNINNLTFKVLNKYKLYGARIYVITGEKGTYAQNRGIYKTYYRDVEDSIELTKPTTIPNASLQIIKVDSRGTTLKQIDFHIKVTQGTEKLYEGDRRTGDGTNGTKRGKITGIDIVPKNEEPIIVEISETSSTEVLNALYVGKIKENVKVQLNLVSNKWVGTVTQNSAQAKVEKENNIEITITNPYIPPIKIGASTDHNGGFTKTDGNGAAFAKAVFQATYKQDGVILETKKSTASASGKVSFNNFLPKTTSNVIVEIEEIETPVGYVLNKKDIRKIEFKLSNNKWVKVSGDGNPKFEYDGVNRAYVALDNVENDSQIEELQILKTDRVTKAKLEGAEFTVTISNIKSYKKNKDDKNVIDVTGGSVEIKKVTTDTNGLLKLYNLVIEDVSKDIVITLEETKAPDKYKKIDGKIKIKLHRQGNTYTTSTVSKDPNVLDAEVGEFSIKNHIVSLNVRNVPNVDTFNMVKTSLNGGQYLGGAEFDLKFENVKSIGGVEATNGTMTLHRITRASDGNFTQPIENIEIKDPSQKIKVTVTETKAPEGHIELQAPVVVYIELFPSSGTYGSSTDIGTNLEYQFPKVSGVITPTIVNNKKYVYLRIKDIPVLSPEPLAFEKTTIDGNKLEGAKFKLTFENVKSVDVGGETKQATGGKLVVENLLTNAQGKFEKDIKNIKIDNTSQPIKITIEETEAPAEYKPLGGPVIIEVTLQSNGKYKITKKETTNVTTAEYNKNDTKMLDGYNMQIKLKDIKKLNPEPFNLVKTSVPAAGGESLAGAKFNVTFENVKSIYVDGEEKVATGGKITAEGMVTGEDGKFVQDVTNAYIDNINNPVIITIEETEAPEGFLQLDGTIQIKVGLNKSTGKYYIVNNGVTKTGQISDIEFKAGNVTLTNGEIVNVKIQDIPKLDKDEPFNLVKTSVPAAGGESLAGAKFDVTFENVKSIYVDGAEKVADGGKVTAEGMVTGEDGKFTQDITDIYIDNRNAPIIVTIEETEAPRDFLKLDGKIQIKVGLDKTTGKYYLVNNGVTKTGKITDIEFKKENVTLTNGNTINVSIKDIPKLDKDEPFNLIKTSVEAAGGESLEGAKFDVTFENVKSIYVDADKKEANGGKVTAEGMTTGEDGKFEQKITDIEVEDRNAPIVITIEETEAPEGFKRLTGRIIIEVSLNGEDGTYFIKANGIKTEVLDGETEGILPAEFNKEDVTITRVGSGDKNKGYTLNVPIENIPNLDNPGTEPVQLIKTSVPAAGGESLAGAEFKVTLSNVRKVEGEELTAEEGVTKVLERTTGADGKFTDPLENIEIKNVNEPIEITIEETKAPEGFKRIEGKIKVKVMLDKEVGNYYIAENGVETEGIILPAEFKAEEVTMDETGYILNIPIKDIPNLDNPRTEPVQLTKTDSQDGTAIAGAEFKVTLSNVRKVEGEELTAEEGATKVLKRTTGADGKFTDPIENIEIEDVNEPIVITIEETQALRGYKRLNGKITVEVMLDHDEGNYYIETVTIDEGINEKEFKEEDATMDEAGYVLSLPIKDIPVMNIGGIVWEDEQSGVKDVAGPDGKLNNKDKGKTKVILTLYKGEEEVTENVYGDELMIATAGSEENDKELTYDLYNGEKDTIQLADGEYIFPNVERGEDYRVVFTYDGINYETVQVSEKLYETTNPKESKAEEIERDAFNAKFGTISDSAEADTEELSYAHAENLNGELTYELNDDPATEIVESKLITLDENGYALENYQMNAITQNYLKTGDKANWQGTWTEEGKINRSHYALDVNCGLTYRFFDLAAGTDVENAMLTINGKTTTYDYAQVINGALSDIDLDKLLDDNVSKDDRTYNLYLYDSDYNYRISDYITDAPIQNNVNSNVLSDTSMYGDDDTLRAFITYKVVLKNQSKVEKARVNELAYYFDNNYEFVAAMDADGNDIDANIDTTIPQVAGKKALKVTGLGNHNLGEGEDYRQELYFVFEVKREGATGDLGLPAEGTQFANMVEILSYSTDKGYVDQDSCPGNYNTIGIEDDTDEAPGIEIKIKDKERIMTGNVWDDGNFKDADGLMADDENKVKDVIVQLIEVKNIPKADGTPDYYEYIWQETRTGSNEVKKLGPDGNTITTVDYDGLTLEDGEYIFEGYIPGNYIVRFIYGDGTTYDMTDDVLKYNGHDYKSTKDPNYKVTWYNEWYNDSTYKDNASVARDNEARRLESMAETVFIDGTIGEDLNTGGNLDKTWMAAETSRINIPIDTDYTTLKETEGGEEVEKGTTHVSFSVIQEILGIENINLGLALRPNTKLKLEKHITGLKITPSGNGVQPIVDATADINDILTRTGSVKVNGITTGLAAMKSTRDSRNFWQVQTDIEELTQGATLEVEYTYVITNDSEEDYLSSDLIGAYGSLSDNINDYKGYLTDTAQNVIKPTMWNGTYSYRKPAESVPTQIGKYLGQWYYTGEKGANDAEVTARAEELQEKVNEKLTAENAGGFKVENTDGTNKDQRYITEEAKFENKEIKQIATGERTGVMAIHARNADRKLKLTTVLSSTQNGEGGGTYPSYIAEITKYSTAAGRRDIESTPENSLYVNSEDKEMNLNNSYIYELSGDKYEALIGTSKSGATEIKNPANEDDEFWGESVIITKPTGEDKITPVQIAIITVSALGVLGVGIILIRKFAIKK